MRYLLIAVTLLAVTPVQAQSSAQVIPSTQMVSARELLGWCSDSSTEGLVACTAYIMGIADAVADPSARSCPGGATRAQMRGAVMQDVVSAARQDLPAAVPVTVALQAAFPCPKQKP